MITQEKLKIYKKYGGDIDGWAGVGKKKELERMNDEDWSLIDTLTQDLEMVEKDLVSDDFKLRAYKRLEESCDNPETQSQIKSMIRG